MEIIEGVIALVAALATASADNGGGVKEYCVTETFEASCPGDHVIVMREARYGRMRIGRCVQTDFGYVGCQNDTMDVLDVLCSGRHTCSVSVPHALLEEKKACNTEFKSYLEASYVCVPVMSATDLHCKAIGTVTIRESSGYLASIVTEETGCGSSNSRWRIEASSGQRINLTLYDFSWGRTDAVVPDRCIQYAVVTEGSTGHPHHVCGRRSRQSAVYLSVTNTVEVSIPRQYHRGGEDHFLLHYQVVGCEDPVLPKYARLEREGHIATITCDSGDRSWEIKCINNKWTGALGNCSAASSGSSLPSRHDRLLSLPMDVAIVIIAGVAFVIGAVIFVIGLYIIRSRRHFARPMGPPRARMYRDDDDPDKMAGFRSEEEWRAAYQLQHKPPPGIYMQTSDTGSANENEYAYVWDTAPPSVSFNPQSPDVAINVAPADKKVNFRENMAPGSRPSACADRSPGSNTNAHDGQYEKRLPTAHTGLDPVYERGAKPHPQYFELDQFNNAPKGSKD